MRCNPLSFKGLYIICSLVFASGLSAQPTSEVGATIFKNVCAQCHNKNMKDDLTGPALGLFEERWADYPREDLYAWIRNSQALIGSGHPRATELWNEWKPTVMQNVDLTDEEIESVFLYIDEQYNKVPVVLNQSDGAAGSKDSSNNFLYWVLFLILAAVAVILARIIGNLNQIAQIQEGGQASPPRSILDVLSSRGVVSFLIFALVVFGGYTTVNNGIDFGRQQGYAPEQPIKFSHATHAGIQGIDCQYCHDGARRSKHAVIPAANTCMNCHRAVTVGSEYGTAEISKIYASIGFNPNDNVYIEDYASMSEDQIKAIYTKWIGDNYIKDAGLSALDRRGERTVAEQWEGIKSSLTNELKPDIPGPIEWIRIHHLPDHVYFSHQQHVAVGKLECQQCHGTVEEMAVMSQYAPLSMGWCINCHRETDVQFADNPYYDNYAKYHEDLATGARTGVTVEEIGGLECQKCHY